jgi:hypothetical protein
MVSLEDEFRNIIIEEFLDNHKVVDHLQSIVLNTSIFGIVDLRI